MNALEVFLGAAAKVQEKGNKKIEYTWQSGQRRWTVPPMLLPVPCNGYVMSLMLLPVPCNGYVMSLIVRCSLSLTAGPSSPFFCTIPSILLQNPEALWAVRSKSGAHSALTAAPSV
jgi:hypothetical protein